MQKQDQKLMYVFIRLYLKFHLILLIFLIAIGKSYHTCITNLNKKSTFKITHFLHCSQDKMLGTQVSMIFIQTILINLQEMQIFNMMIIEFKIRKSQYTL